VPPKSKAQARYLRAVASGKVKKKGLSSTKAEEYVSGYDTKNLPERVGSKSHRSRRGKG
jgi:hypothetical protein